MKNHYCFIIVLFLAILNNVLLAAPSTERKVYVVYLGEHSGEKSFKEIEENHCSFLQKVKGYSQEEARASLVHSFKNVINGFSALLTPQEANKISEMEGVISVFHSGTSEIKPQTTRSWDFVSLLERVNGNPTAGGGALLRNATNKATNVIVGLIDTGVWPESPSFSDVGMGPIPTSWKGICQNGSAFNSSHCNRKLIGARYYIKSYEATYGRLNGTLDFRSPRDINGHGTHTASTVAGRRVPNAAALGGFAPGTASGGAPQARLAIYKVCWPIPNRAGQINCFDDDILAAFDDAISDGVDVISVSLGAIPGQGYYKKDGIAIGALHAVKRKIVVACSAGNSGPTPSTVGNVAPWIITVGASTIDRVFSAPLKLGNGMIIEGQTITPINTMKMLPLVYAGDVEIPGATNIFTTGRCFPGTLSSKQVRGKIVVCLSTSILASLGVQKAGGAATVLGYPYNEIQVTDFLQPTTVVSSYELVTIIKYIRSDVNPTAAILPGNTVIGTKPAPVMASFTSLGPSIIEPNILKPDITAPGFNILAAWSGASSPTELLGIDNRVVKYNIMSGTSMSCPHVSAIATLLKSIHPHWSSAAIRSALITTATTNNVMGAPIMNATGYLATPFEYGAGHFQPSDAADPGLIYDASYDDYILYLCSKGITIDPSFKCPKNAPTPSDLNYPSLSIANLQGPTTLRRTVTNVGEANSTYVVTVSPPLGYTVVISPTTLRFSQQDEQRKFNVTIKRDSNTVRRGFDFGWYSWSDGTHIVRSPIVVSSA